MPAQNITPCHPLGLAVTRIEALRNEERLSWLCQSQGNEAPAVLVTGWTGLVRQLTIECIDFVTAPQAFIKANDWLTGTDGIWHFEENGSASWRIILPDGVWAATLMTAGLTLAEAQRKLRS